MQFDRLDASALNFIYFARAQGYRVQAYFVGLEDTVKITSSDRRIQSRALASRKQTMPLVHQLAKAANDIVLYDNSTLSQTQAFVLRYSVEQGSVHRPTFATTTDKIRDAIADKEPANRAAKFREQFCRTPDLSWGEEAKVFYMPTWAVRHFWCPILDIDPIHFGF